MPTTCEIIWSLGPNQVTYPISVSLFLAAAAVAKIQEKNLEKIANYHSREMKRLGAEARLEKTRTEIDENLSHLIFATGCLVPIAGPFIAKKISQKYIGNSSTIVANTPYDCFHQKTVF